LQSYPVYLAYRVLLRLTGCVPRSLALCAVDFLASLAYWLDRPHRRIARTNLRLAFPDLDLRARDRIGRLSFCQTARNLVELSRIERHTRESIARLVEYDPEAGLGNFQAARARGKPILYLTGHFSAWELLPAAHALYGHPLSFVTRPLDNLRLERHLRRLREASGNRVIPKKDSARRILEALKQGADVGLLIDQNTTLAEGIYVELFGLPAATTSSLALLALRTDATVLAGYLTPPRGGKYRIRFLPPIDLVRSGDRTRDLEANTRCFNEVVERIVREQPESWLWGHKRWKNQPGGEDVYAMSDEELDRYAASWRAARQRPESAAG
jgi:KDO2-lipid IV(A) lauroyltransferase